VQLQGRCDGKRYPPKYVISIASKIAVRKKLTPAESMAAQRQTNSCANSVCHRHMTSVSDVRERPTEMMSVKTISIWLRHGWKPRQSWIADRQSLVCDVVGDRKDTV
jgi:hypothetical protein